MRVLITGKNSFLAKEIQDFFSDKEHDIIPTSRQTLDVSNPENVDDYFENIVVDVVIHTAIKGGTFGQTRQEVPKTPISDLIFGGLGGANLGQRLFPGSSIAPVLGGLAGGLGGLF